MEELSKLVQRLRELTGQCFTDIQRVGYHKTISDDSIQFFQQSLRRHPCLFHFGRSKDEEKSIFFTQLKECVTAPPCNNEHSKTLEWINALSDDLELERLSFVFSDPQSFNETCIFNFLEELGYEQKPDYNQNDLSYASPWNVWLPLLSGPLVSYQFRDDKRAIVTVPNATLTMKKHLGEINLNAHNVAAWKLLLREADSFPLAVVRSLWLAALYFFPSCGTLVGWYLRKEIDELSTMQKLSACLSEDDAKKVFKSSIRILNCFYRHLPLCFDCRLYEMFFEFIQTVVEPDVSSLEELYRVALHRDVGDHILSTNIWTGYVAIKASCFQDINTKREWKKKIYHRMLQTPLVGLERVKEAYDTFTTSEYRGRITPEEKYDIEKAYNRSRSAATDLAKLMTDAGVCLDQQAETGLLLPKPVLIDEILSVSHSEIDVWAAWFNIIQTVKRSVSSSADTRQFERVLKFLFMRAAVFPFQLDSWFDIVFYCRASRNSIDQQRKVSILKRVVNFTSLFMHRELCIQLLQVDIAASYLKNQNVSLLLRKALHFHCDEVLCFIGGTGCSHQMAAEHLRSICILLVTWMKIQLTQGSRFHVRLIARYALHNIDFLSLSMGATRRLLKGEDPSLVSRMLHPFHVFCCHWIRLEILRNKAVDECLIILARWKDHILLLLKSLSKLHCSAECCGADELFIDCCRFVVKAEPSSMQTVMALVLDLENSVKGNEIEGKTFLPLVERMKYSLFAAPALQDMEDTLSASTPLNCQFASPQRIDTNLFWSKSTSHEFTNANWMKVVTTPSNSTEIKFPEESLWVTPTHPDSATFFSKRKRDDESCKDQKRFCVECPGYVLNLSTNILSLEELVEQWTKGSHVSLKKLEGCITQLPGLFEYVPELSTGKRTSSQWILSALEQCDGF